MAARVVNNQLKNLRDLFARLFPRANQIDRVLNDANVDAAQVDLNGSALDQWNKVFVFTEFQRQTQRLIEVALSLFPGNEQLRLASEGHCVRFVVPNFRLRHPRHRRHWRG